MSRESDERIVKFKNGDLIPVDRPLPPFGHTDSLLLADAAAHTWVRALQAQWGTQAMLLDVAEEQERKTIPLPWYLRVYGMVDPVEFSAAVGLLLWWATLHF